MENSFDKVAQNYDTTFTNTLIGKAQRSLVYLQLSELLNRHRPKTILELNCGTGEDAIWLAKQNFNVTATDISHEMIAIAENKTRPENLCFRVADINRILSDFSDKKYDLIVSNFGGLNCLNKRKIESFFENSHQLLTEKGEMVLVIMPKDTIWEQLYFLAKADIQKAFRRKKEYAVANVEGKDVATFYYNPKDIVHLSETNFKMMTANPIGFFVPPSYLESFFKNKPKTVAFLKKMDAAVRTWSFLAKYADHFLIVLQKR